MQNDRSCWAASSDYDLEVSLSHAEGLLARIEEEERHLTILKLLGAVAFLIVMAILALGLLAVESVGTSQSVGTEIALALLVAVGAISFVMIGVVHVKTRRSIARRRREARVMMAIAGAVREILPARARQEEWSNEKFQFMNSRVSRFPITAESYQ